MTLPDNIDITALLVEKCRRSGATWLQRLAHKSESEAVAYLTLLQNRYRSFYTSLTKEEVMDRINEIVYQLSIDGNHILGIGLYKELKGCSLEEAYNKQKEMMAVMGNAVLKDNLLLQLKNRAVNTNGANNINRLVHEMNGGQQPVKKYLLPQIILAAAIGFLAYLSVAARQRGDFSKAGQYTLFATFCIMALVMLILLRLYNGYAKRRRDRGEVIRKG